MNDSLTNRDSVSESAKHRDAVSPTPWRVEKSPNNSNFWVVRCDTGVSIATAWREADAAYIVEAVKAEVASRELGPAMMQELADESRRLLAERDRLRDIVRRLADIVRHDCDVNAMAVTREAYAALEEEVPE